MAQDRSCPHCGNKIEVLQNGEIVNQVESQKPQIVPHTTINRDEIPVNSPEGSRALIAFLKRNRRAVIDAIGG